MIPTILALWATPSLATGPHTRGNPSREYLLSRTRSSSPDDVPKDFDCAWRRAAYNYSTVVQPWLSSDAGKMKILHDALELNVLCGDSFAVGTAPIPASLKSSSPDAAADCQVFVDAANGNDANPGSESKPLRTLAAAVVLSRQCTGAATVLLQSGTYRVDKTITLDGKDSGLTITAAPGAKTRPRISGGVELGDLEWQSMRHPTNGVPIFKAKVPSGKLPAGILSLRLGGQRVTRARYPNANPEIDHFPTGYVDGATGWGRPEYDGTVCDPNNFCGPSETRVVPVSDAWHGMYQNWTRGYGGNCDKYTPNDSVWCSDKFYLERQLPEMHARAPASILVNDNLPNAPYKDARGAEIHTWRLGHWYSWFFRVGEVKPGFPVKAWKVYQGSNNINGLVPTPGSSTSTVTFLGNFDSADACWAACNKTGLAQCQSWTWHSPQFAPDWGRGCYAHNDSYWSPVAQDLITSGRGPHQQSTEYRFDAGGNQGGEGADTAAEWFITNVFEELDAPNEYFYDESESTLYLCFNGTGTPPRSVVVPTLETVLSLQGTREAPVRNVTISRIAFEDTKPTYMGAHGSPSGGDWSLQRIGALLFEGTEGCVVTENLFVRLDSTALFLSGYNRATRIVKNDFEWLGMGAVALWGRLDEPKSNRGLKGNQPRGTLFQGNFAREIGIYQKQSSCLFQAITAQTTIVDNLCFNIPRAGINFNDGFGGGSEIARNLMFNTCRESSDHGAFNSWDRLPYVTAVRDGTPSSIPAENQLHNNFIVSNYAADGGCFDHDDGSAYYTMRRNFCVFGGHKSDFDGHSKKSIGNLHVYPFVYMTTCVDIGAQVVPPEGYAEVYQNNTCILPAADSIYVNIDGTDLTNDKLIRGGFEGGNNRIFVPGAKAHIVGVDGKMPFSEWKDKGYDPRTTISGDMPSTEQIIRWGIDLLAEE